jgi:16S rRNA (cytosine1402-N4)-methyltransferase
MKSTLPYHSPVLLDEVISLLVCKRDGVYLDGTLGGGGHFSAIAEKLGPDATLIGIDQDEEAINWTRDHFKTGRDFTLILEQSRFSDFDMVLKRYSIPGLDGILLDLGVSSHQIDSPERGFS